MSRLLERLLHGPVLVADGGTGALLMARVPRLRCPEEANVVAPEAVLAVHRAFIAAGAELIETNTFGANRAKLTAQLLDDQLEQIVGQGVRIARDARELAAHPVLIAGSIGPLGEAEPSGLGASRAEAFAEQARLLEARGVDLFALETFYDLDELEAAIQAVQSVSGLPIVAALTFDTDAHTAAGSAASTAAQRLRATGVVAIGANCGRGPQATLAALREMSIHADGLPLVAKPNVGLGEWIEGRVVYPAASSDYFAEFAAQARGLGARIVGGCCGTTPAQIAAIRAAVEEAREPRASLLPVRQSLEPELTAQPKEAGTLLERRLEAGEWVVSVEVDPPRGSNLTGLLRLAQLLKSSGAVHVLDVNEGAHARARMGALFASVALERDAGIETIPHVTVRDASSMGLQAQLLGAHAEGIRNLLVIRGDPPSIGDYAGSSGVYELDSIDLVEMVSRFNRGEDFAGRAIDVPTSFFVGVAVNPAAVDLDWEVERFRRKLDAGARFAMTQVLYDLAYLDRFLDRLGGPSPIPILLGVLPLRSYATALRLHNEVPGIVVPEPILDRLRDAGADAAAVGSELARSLIEQARPLLAGIYLIPPFKEPASALDLLM